MAKEKITIREKEIQKEELPKITFATTCVKSMTEFDKGFIEVSGKTAAEALKIYKKVKEMQQK